MSLLSLNSFDAYRTWWRGVVVEGGKLKANKLRDLVWRGGATDSACGDEQADYSTSGFGCRCTSATHKPTISPSQRRK